MSEVTMAELEFELGAVELLPRRETLCAWKPKPVWQPKHEWCPPHHDPYPSHQAPPPPPPPPPAWQHGDPCDW